MPDRLTATLLLALLASCGVRPARGSDEQSDRRRTAPKPSVVLTKYGSLRGVVEAPGRHLAPVEVFLGVPYAGSPVGSLRFLPPGTPPQWKGVRAADRFGPVCPQWLPDIANETDALQRMPAGRLDLLRRLLPFLANQSEDCLYLNIYAPAPGARNAKSKLPVLFFIHGESYDWNSGNPYDGSVLASVGNIIVITINFRLGIFGFLPALDGSSRGNYGIMDQVAALHWVQENVAEFGGDPRRVTVAGHGHGAACANLLMLSPLTKGLFRRAILQSGSALSPWAIARTPLLYARQVARRLRCPTEDSAALVECLRQRPVSDFLEVRLQAPDHLAAFGPTVDGVVIPGEPEQLMDKQAELFAQFDLLAGVARLEAYNGFSGQEDLSGIDVARRDRLLRTLVRNLFTYHLQEIFLTVVNEYTDWSKPDQHPINVLDATADAAGDAVVVAPLVRAANLHARARRPHDPPATYLYVFTHQTEDAAYSQRAGCVSGEELPYAFGAPLLAAAAPLAFFPRNFTRAEAALAESVVGYWANFVRHGNPNGPSSDMESSDKPKNKVDKVLWPEYNETHQKYLSIGVKPRPRDHYHAHRLSFWLHLIPTLHRASPADSSASHHLLDDHHNPATYDGVVRNATDNATDNGTAPPPLTTTPAAAAAATAARINTSAYATLIILEERPTAAPHPPRSLNITDSLAMIFQQGAYSTALTVTIGIGCSLLILNIIIFAGVYLNRDRHHAHHVVDYKERS